MPKRRMSRTTRNVFGLLVSLSISAVAFSPTHLQADAISKSSLLPLRPKSSLLSSNDMSDEVFAGSNRESIPQIQRRDFLNGALATAAFLSVAPAESRATVISTSTKVGTLDALSIEEAEQRFRAGRESVAYLLKNYDEICEGGGDNVRRYLGTVGTTSGLFGIQKAMKTLAEKADDIVEYTELATEIEKTIQQADGSSYMAIFTVTSTSGVPPEKYFKDARIEIERCARDLDELAGMIGLKL